MGIIKNKMRRLEYSSLDNLKAFAKGYAKIFQKILLRKVLMGWQ